MVVVQDNFYMPDDIATGLATDIYRRIGSVIRYATGPNKGQIVKHLKPIDLKSAEQAKNVGEKALEFVQHHKKEVGIAAIGVGIVTVGLWGYSKWSSYEPKVLSEFRVSLKNYIDAIRNGNMNIDIIEKLMNDLEALKEYKNYDKINIQLTTEEIEVLVSHIYEYTIKLASDNSVELSEDELKPNGNSIINLQTYLEVQKKIFEKAA